MKKQKTCLPYARHSITAEDVQEVAAALESGCITRGKRVRIFEQTVAGYCGAAYGVAFSSGTAALLAACHVVDLNAFDRVITTPNTYIATVGAGLQHRANPVFIDIDRETGNLDIEQLKYNLDRPSTRAKTVIIPVHFSGIPVDVSRIEHMISDPKTIIIEDAAHALGSSYADGRKVGCCAYSTMAIFSFHPSKTITTAEGGMVMTNDEELHHRLRRFRDNGIERDPQHLEGEPFPGYYEVQEIAGNYHLTEIQAALGISQFRRLDDLIGKKRSLVQAYRERLKAIPHIRLFTDRFDAITAYHLFVIQIDFSAYQTTREEVMKKLEEGGIGTEVHYIPIYRHPCFSRTGDISEYFPHMEAYYSQALSLPLFYDLTEDDIDYVVATLKKILLH
ncbi:MAG: DegT/DnrJ/EryC1/StrS family aminotransferase [Waddliaceae bacterium]